MGSFERWKAKVINERVKTPWSTAWDFVRAGVFGVCCERTWIYRLNGNRFGNEYLDLVLDGTIGYRASRFPRLASSLSSLRRDVWERAGGKAENQTLMKQRSEISSIVEHN